MENSQRHEGVGDGKEKMKKTGELLGTLVMSAVNQSEEMYHV